MSDIFISDWRLPSIEVLERLYDPKNKSDYKIREPFKLTGSLVWSSTKKGSGSAWFFRFNLGQRYNNILSNSHGKRALCVRSFKE
jgi:hypothetical protein